MRSGAPALSLVPVRDAGILGCGFLHSTTTSGPQAFLQYMWKQENYLQTSKIPLSVHFTNFASDVL